MPRLNPRQALALLLSALILHPFQLWAVSPQSSGPVRILGSIASYGSVQVAGFPAPPESTLFAGDQVSTGTGRAVIQYAQGARILLADESAAQFSPEQVLLQKGQMTFRSVAQGGPAYVVATLRLEPATAESAASVTLSDAKVSISVSEGSVRLIDSETRQTFSMTAGETRDVAVVFPSASSASTPSAVPPAPQRRGSSGAAYWLVGLAAGAAGGAVAARSLSGSDVEQAPDVSRSRP